MGLKEALQIKPMELKEALEIAARRGNEVAIRTLEEYAQESQESSAS